MPTLPSSVRVIVRDWLVNTHCYSDHMGGIAALQGAHGDSRARGNHSKMWTLRWNAVCSA